jgi:hypothetical protein
MTYGKELKNHESQLASILVHCKKIQPKGIISIMSDDVLDFGMTERQFHKALLRAEKEGVLTISGRYWVEDATNEEVEKGSALIATVDYHSTKEGKKDEGKKWVDYDDGFQVSTDKERARHNKKSLGLTKSHTRILERILREPKRIVVSFGELADSAKIDNVSKNIATYVSDINSAIRKTTDGKMEKYLNSDRGIGYYR